MFKILVILKNAEVSKQEDSYSNVVINYSVPAKVNDVQDYDLCIIEADFGDKQYLSKVKKFIASNANIEFWAGNSLCTRENIVTAYSLGCKNFIKFPITEEVINRSFAGKNSKFPDNAPTLEMGENFENMKVLVIDDNEVNVELLRELLSIFKLKTICFNNSKHALKYAKSEKVDLILLDIMMPRINGFEFAQEIKKESSNKTTPVVFVSALNGRENKIKGFTLGSHAYIEKPFDVNTVRAQLFNILKIQKLQKQKESFIATLTHDLRTPIRAQVRALELLLAEKFGVMPDEQKNIVREILSSCKFLNFMTEDLLAKYKFENGSMTVKKDPHNLQRTIEDIIHSLKYIIEQKQQSIIYNYKSKILHVDIDLIEFSRVMNNIIVNASEYSPEHGNIIIEVTDKPQFLEISVADSGKGLREDDIDLIFEEYHTKAKSFNKIGAGLGLFISRKIIELHGGEIRVEIPETGIGSKFVFTLPCSMALV